MSMLRSTVLLNVKDRDLIGFVEEAKKHIEKTVPLPNGYTIEWAGQYENQTRANQRLTVLLPLALLINLIIIYLGIKNLRNSAIIFSAIPIAMSGGLILLWLGGFNSVCCRLGRFYCSVWNCCGRWGGYDDLPSRGD